MPQNNYTLGRGEVHFARFKAGTQTPDGYRYFGNTPQFSFTIESEELDHYSSDRGIREKDDSVPLEVNRTGSLTTDEISPDNVALFFFGQKLTLIQAAIASTTYAIADIHPGHAYKLGQNANNPAGYLGINPTGFGITIGGTPLVMGVDFSVDFDMGIITFLDGSTVALEGTDPVVTAAIRASSRSRVISGSTPVEGALMYRSYNPKGPDSVIHMPYVKVTPNGDFELKGDDWQQIPLSLEILKPSVGEAIYRDGVPAYS